MTALDPALDHTVRLPIHDHGQVAATVPHLLGFHPTDSLVVVTLTDRDPPGLGVTVRIDLPPPWHVEQAAESVVTPLVLNNVGAVSLVLIGSAREDPATPPSGWTAPGETGPPHRPLVTALTAALADADIEVLHAMWLPRCAAEQTWWCYESPECSGQMPDPESSALAAVTVLAGGVTYGSRAELAAVLEPGPPQAWRRTAALLSERSRVPPRPLSLLLDTMACDGDEVAALAGVDGCEQVADLISALRAPDVRTACMTMAIDDRAPGAERLWTALTRATPPPWRAEPACLLAMSAYARGRGVLASVAVEAALDADPDHGLATLLDHALKVGLPQPEIRRMLAQLATESGGPAPDPTESP